MTTQTKVMGVLIVLLVIAALVVLYMPSKGGQ
jgi:competence protein ComGC